MKRYFRWYGAIFRMSLDNFLAYRTDAVITTIFSSGVWSLFNIFSMYLVTLRIPSAYGYSRGELILISCIYNVIVGVFSFFVGKGVRQLSDFVATGKFDLFLLQPVDAQLSESLYSVSINSGFRTVLGSIMAVYIVSIYHIPIAPIDILWFALSVVCSVILLYSLVFSFNTLVIWSPRLDNINELFYTLRSLGRYPRNVFRQLGEVGFVLVSPFVIVLAGPAKILLGKATWYDVTELLLLTSAAFVAARLFWKFALRYYTSASS